MANTGKCLNTALVAGALVLGFGVAPERAEAIPAFARAYRTSCQTCHTVYPRLNAFGEAFRRNGYQFPGGQDELFLKEENVALGAAATRQAFPNAVLPGALPHLPPVSFVIESEMVYKPEAKATDDPSTNDPSTDFRGFGGEAEMLLGGTAGEDISYFAEIEFAGEEVEIERSFVGLHNLAGPALNLKAGMFEPGVLSFSNLRRNGPEYWMKNKTKTAPVAGKNKWSLEAVQQGFEANGSLAGRLGYNLGLVEGKRNEANNDKDLYAHVEYKLGGMRLDGVAAGQSDPTASSQPWVDDSLRLGAFYYKGNASLKQSVTATSSILYGDTFNMTGVDLNGSMGSTNLLLAVAVQDNDRPTYSGSGLTTNHSVVEVTHVVYPWLVPAARIEAFHTDGSAYEERFVPYVNLLLRANVKTQIAFEWEHELKSNNDRKWEMEEVEASLAVAF